MSDSRIGVHVTAFQIAERFAGLTEISGEMANPQIMAMLKLDMGWPDDDEVPWCSAFVNYVAWLLRLPRSKSLRARSWLQIGLPIRVEHAVTGFDVAILKRGKHPQPGPEVIEAIGHVGFYASQGDGKIHLLGGNQGDKVTVATFPLSSVLGIRRL